MPIKRFQGVMFVTPSITGLSIVPVHKKIWNNDQIEKQSRLYFWTNHFKMTLLDSGCTKKFAVRNGSNFMLILF